MRIDVQPIVEQAERLVCAIADKSKSRASSEAYKLLGVLPNPTWAETAPGVTIHYGTEAEAANRIEALRYSVLTWLRALIDPTLDWEPTAEWPQPEGLIMAIRELEAFATQNASTS